MTASMRAAVLSAIGEPLAVQEAPRPVVAADEVLVETRTCGICRTDLHIQDGLAYVPNLPHIPGHEPSGIIAAVGAAVSGLTVGQRVVPHLFVYDGECAHTRQGRHAQATHLRGIIGVTLPGGFAQFFKAPARNLLVLPGDVSFEVGGLTSCAAITAVHAFRKAPAGAETAAVIGAGGIGAILLQLLRDAGIRAAAVDRSPASLRLAEQCGAELAVFSEDAAAVERLRDFGGNGRDGVDVVFELVGRAETMRLAAAATARAGRIVVIGEEPDFPAINTITLAQRELEIVGSRNGGLDDAGEALALMARGVIAPPIAARFPLSKINEAFSFVRTGAVPGRVIVTIDESS